ncbi:MAG: hypothetical protein K0S53_3258 [Bacteroidetes bacterium]|jgi:hypothetical protein|nr:hypothetical protein [Bacteroidota bacterium]
MLTEPTLAKIRQGCWGIALPDFKIPGEGRRGFFIKKG